MVVISIRRMVMIKRATGLLPFELVAVLNPRYNKIIYHIKAPMANRAKTSNTIKESVGIFCIASGEVEFSTITFTLFCKYPFIFNKSNGYMGIRAMIDAAKISTKRVLGLIYFPRAKRKTEHAIIFTILSSKGCIKRISLLKCISISPSNLVYNI